MNQEFPSSAGFISLGVFWSSSLSTFDSEVEVFSDINCSVFSSLSSDEGGVSEMISATSSDGELVSLDCPYALKLELTDPAMSVEINKKIASPLVICCIFFPFYLLELTY